MDNDTATGREWAGLAVLALPTKGPALTGCRGISVSGMMEPWTPRRA